MRCEICKTGYANISNFFKLLSVRCCDGCYPELSKRITAIDHTPLYSLRTRLNVQIAGLYGGQGRVEDTEQLALDCIIAENELRNKAIKIVEELTEAPK